jgi:hypothetical protein
MVCRFAQAKFAAQLIAEMPPRARRRAGELAVRETIP